VRLKANSQDIKAKDHTTPVQLVTVGLLGVGLLLSMGVANTASQRRINDSAARSAPISSFKAASPEQADEGLLGAETVLPEFFPAERDEAKDGPQLFTSSIKTTRDRKVVGDYQRIMLTQMLERHALEHIVLANRISPDELIKRHMLELQAFYQQAMFQRLQVLGRRRFHSAAD
jgi:hypothetical protein